MTDQRKPFLEFLENEVVVFDGGLGTELYSRGVFINRSFDELNLTNPALVTEIHRSYAEAGADVLETNTFGANRVKLRHHGLAERLGEINREGARLARETAGPGRYIAGAIGPLGIRIEPWGPTSVDEARAIFREQAEALHAGGVDVFILETFSDLPEIRSALSGVRDATDRPIIAQMTLEEDGNSLEGVSPEEFAAKLDSFGADVIGVNCSVGPHAMLAAIEKMATATARRLSAQPNAGTPRSVDGRNLYLCSPEYMASYARRFIQAGARVVGGCCGTTPEHIRAIRRSVRSLAPLQQDRPVVIRPSEGHHGAEPVPRAGRSELARKLAAKRFVHCVEVIPPKGCDAETVLAASRLLRAKGIDAVNVADGPRASARMTPQALAHLIQTEVGIEAMVHYTCRDRNLLGMQSELLGAYAIGIKNLVLVTGEPARVGDYPDATAALDVDSVGLTNMVNRLNHGLDMGGGDIGRPTGFLIGVGVNPTALDLAREVRRFEWKVDAGAEYAVTQPLFDLAALETFLERIAHVRIPIIAGIWPLASYRDAEFLNNEVPGMRVPPGVLERMRSADSDGAALAEGVAIAREMLEGVRRFVEGARVSTPFERYETAIEVLDGFVEDSPAAKREIG